MSGRRTIKRSKQKAHQSIFTRMTSSISSARSPVCRRFGLLKIHKARLQLMQFIQNINTPWPIYSFKSSLFWTLSKSTTNALWRQLSVFAPGNTICFIEVQEPGVQTVVDYYTHTWV